MKIQFKKVISLVMVFQMVLLCIPANVFANDLYSRVSNEIISSIEQDQNLDAIPVEENNIGGTSSINSEAYAKGLDGWVTTAYMTQQGDKVTVNAQVTNNTGTEIGVNVIAAAYDETEKMLSYSLKDADIATTNEFIFDLDVSQTTSEFIVKVFTWDSVTNLPLSEAVTLTNGQIISINTEGLKPIDESQALFLLEDKLDSLSGTVTGNLDLDSMKLTIAVGKFEIADMSITPAKNWSVENPPFIVGSNEVTVFVTTAYGEVFSKKFIIVNESEKNSTGIVLDENDDDDDGLLNWQEYAYGTDKDNRDTDGDGLTDYEEIFITFTNPLQWDSNRGGDGEDSDGHGISDGEKDFDGDGLTNIQECFYGTDPYNTDTDEDGLSDYDEIFVYFTNSLLADSDSDGLPDGLEIKYGMNPLNQDTLADGILDGDRIFTVTVSSNDTSENDMVKPLLEIELQGKKIESLTIDKVSEDDTFLNTKTPGFIGNAFDFNVDGDFSSATLSFELDPSLFNDPDFVPAIYYWDEDAQFLFELPNQKIGDKKLSAEFDQQINNTFSEIGQASLIDQNSMPETNYRDNEAELIEEVPRKIDESEISSELGQSLYTVPDLPLESNNHDEDNEYLPKSSDQTEQAIDGNIISAEIQHFSKYIVLAKNIHDEELFRFEILPPADEEMQNTKFDLALVLDESGSISSSNYTQMKNLARDLISKLDEKDRIAVFTFDNIITRRSGFVDKSTAGSIVAGLSQGGGTTAIYNAINAANNLFISSSSADASKIMIVLTDGQDNASTVSSSAVTQTAVNNKIVIYTVGVGSVNTSVLTNIAQSTGGKYYSASNFSQLEDIFNRLKGDADLYKDTDGDGLSDYHEKKIAAGELKLGNGEPLIDEDLINLADFACLDYLNPDSDGDGLLDGKELQIKMQYVGGKEVYYCYLYSNPCMADSDGDGLRDDIDPEPLIYDRIVIIDPYMHVRAISGSGDYLGTYLSYLNGNNLNNLIDFKAMATTYAIRNQIKIGEERYLYTPPVNHGFEIDLQNVQGKLKYTITLTPSASTTVGSARISQVGKKSEDIGGTIINSKNPAKLSFVLEAGKKYNIDVSVYNNPYGRDYSIKFKMDYYTFSNSSLRGYTKKLSHIRGSGERTNVIKKITIHHAVTEPNQTLDDLYDIFNKRGVSSNYGIDNNGLIGMFVEEKYAAITSSTIKSNQVPPDGSNQGVLNDHQAITIEVMNSKYDDVTPGFDWPVSDKALASIINLCVDICQRNGIQELVYDGTIEGSNLTRHNMFSRTLCPGPYLQSRYPYIVEEVNKKLKELL